MGGVTLRGVTAAQLAIHTDGAVSCGTRLWRFRGRLQLTVIVKAVFAIVPDGVAAPAGPGEIIAEDHHRDGHPMRSVDAASDLAPCLIRCDVLFTGHAHAPGGPAAVGAVRLGLSRDGQRLLDKTIHVYGDRGPAGKPEPFTRMPIVYERAVGGITASNPIGTETPNLADPTDPQKPAGFGPISRLWPVRRRLIEKLDRHTFTAPIAEIPESMPWEYFQAAPTDQRIDMLRGGEWLVLDGLHPTLARAQTRLPASRGAARVVARGPGGAPAESVVELVCDTLAIDGDRQTLSLTWRGRHELPEGEASLASLTVLAALEAPGVPVDWARVRGTAAHDAPAAHHDATVAMDATQLGSTSPVGAALPFGPAGALARPPSIDATPWSALPVQPAPSAAPGDATLAPQPSPVRRAKDSNKTVALPVARQEALAGLPAVPFTTSAREPARAPAEPPALVALPLRSEPPPPPAFVALPPVPPPHAEPPPFVALPPEPPPRAEPPPFVAPAPLRSEPPPAMVAPPLPPPDPWARPVAPPPEPPAPPRPPQPVAFERPAAAAVRNSFYSKFTSK